MIERKQKIMKMKIHYKLFFIILITVGINNCATTNIFQAIEKGDTDFIEKILINKPNEINKQNIDGETPIIVSIKNENIEITNFLIENGADLTDAYPLLVNSSHEMISMFLKHNLDNTKKYYLKRIEHQLFSALRNPLLSYNNIIEMKESNLFESKSFNIPLKRINQIIEKHFQEVIIVGNLYDYDKNDEFWIVHDLEPHIDKTVIVNVTVNINKKNNIKSLYGNSFNTLEELMLNAGYYMLSKSQQIATNKQNIELFGFPMNVDDNGYFYQKDILYSSKKINSKLVGDLYGVHSIYISNTNTNDVKMISIKPGLMNNMTKTPASSIEPIVKYFIIPIKYLSYKEILKNYPNLLNGKMHLKRLDKWLSEKGY